MPKRIFKLGRLDPIQRPVSSTRNIDRNLLHQRPSDGLPIGPDDADHPRSFEAEPCSIRFLPKSATAAALSYSCPTLHSRPKPRFLLQLPLKQCNILSPDELTVPRYHLMSSSKIDAGKPVFVSLHPRGIRLRAAERVGFPK